MYPRLSWPVGGPAAPPAPRPSFVVPGASRASPPFHQDTLPYGYYSGVSGQPLTQSDFRPYAPLEYVEPEHYNTIPPDVHHHRLPSSCDLDTSIGPDLNLNPNSNMFNYPYTPSDFDMSQYPFSPRPKDSAPHTPSTLSDGTGYSTTPSDSGSLMSHQLVHDTFRSKDPDLQRLVDTMLSLGFLPDLYVAQFFLIKRVSGLTQPVSNRRNRGEKPRPKEMLEYQCLWCRDWLGYSKEKAKQHILIDLEVKPFTCVEPKCTWKTARPSDLTRHMRLVHKRDQPRKKPGGAMQAGKPFLELQEAYRNGERASPVDASKNSSHVSATTNSLTFAAHTQPMRSHPERIDDLARFTDSTWLDQVCLRRHTQYNWLRWRRDIWVTPVFAVLGTDCYSVCIRKPAELLNSNSIAPKLAGDATSKQIQLFLWSTVIYSALGATIMIAPAQIQNNENSKDIPKPFPTTSNKQIPPDHSTLLNLRRALSERRRRALHPECHPNKDSPAMFSYAFSSHACKYTPLSTATIGNQPQLSASLEAPQYCLSANIAS